MDISRVLPVIAAAGLLLVGLPAGALLDEEAPEVPEICGDRDIALEEDEILVEHTLWFTGSVPAGNVDGAQDLAELQNSPDRLGMSSDEPDSPLSKMYVGPSAAGNPDVSGNPLLGYWTTDFLNPRPRIVCAEATVYASTMTGSVDLQFWYNHEIVGEGPRFVAPAEAEPGAPAAYSANFGEMDFRPYNLMIQVDSGVPGGALFYDSTTHPSHLTFVTVEQVENADFAEGEN